MKQIEISGIRGKGKYAFVDDADFEYINQWKWCLDPHGYAIRNQYIKGSGRKHQKQCIIRMHRLINQTLDGFDTDHIDQNKLNNQRANLRTASRSQNMLNTGLKKTNTSGYKGVTLHKVTGKWRAQIVINYKQIHLGYFDNIQTAWLARRWGERLYGIR